jgi:hypothetical protein
VIGKTIEFLRREVLQGTASTGLASLVPVKNLAAAPSETNEALAPQPRPVPGDELNTSDILVETLIDWRATHVFGIVSDGINSIIEALRSLGEGREVYGGELATEFGVCDVFLLEFHFRKAVVFQCGVVRAVRRTSFLQLGVRLSLRERPWSRPSLIQTNDRQSPSN